MAPCGFQKRWGANTGVAHGEQVAEGVGLVPRSAHRGSFFAALTAGWCTNTILRPRVTDAMIATRPYIGEPNNVRHWSLTARANHRAVASPRLRSEECG
jgi:hypothetical protein